MENIILNYITIKKIKNNNNNYNNDNDNNKNSDIKKGDNKGKWERKGREIRL